jgi:hypothetical protein
MRRFHSSHSFFSAAILSVAIFSFSGCATMFVPPEPPVSVQYDRFTKSTTVTMDDSYRLTEDRPKLLIIGDAESKSVTLGLISTRSLEQGWRYLYCHPLAILADGNPVSVGETKYDGRTGDWLLESVSVHTNADTIRRLAGSRQVEMKLCGTEFALNQYETAALKEFSRNLDAGIIPHATP